MADKKFNLPMRKWYNLTQAADYISEITGKKLEIGDIIHHWLIGNIDLATNVFFESGKLEYNIENGMLKYNTKPSEHFCLGSIKIPMEDIFFYRAVNLKQMEEDVRDSNLLQNENFIARCYKMGSRNGENLKEFYTIPATYVDIDVKSDDDIENYDVTILKGMIYIQLAERSEIAYSNFYQLENEILNNGLSTKLTNTFSQYDADTKKIFTFFISLKQDYQLRLDDLYVTQEAMEEFLKTPVQTAKQANRKTLNAQEETIRKLIKVFYSEAVANNIRKELDNPYSEISMDFDKAGLTAPSGKTLDKWINKI